MTDRLIDYVARAQGFCCDYALLKFYKDWTLRPLEKRLGISKTQIRTYREEVVYGLIGPCDKCEEGDDG